MHYIHEAFNLSNKPLEILFVDVKLGAEEIEEGDIDDESETYELLVNFRVDENEYGLYIPLDPF